MATSGVGSAALCLFQSFAPTGLSSSARLDGADPRHHTVDYLAADPDLFPAGFDAVPFGEPKF